MLVGLEAVAKDHGAELNEMMEKFAGEIRTQQAKRKEKSIRLKR